MACDGTKASQLHSEARCGGSHTRSWREERMEHSMASDKKQRDASLTATRHNPTWLSQSGAVRSIKKH
jgi:hypothetical protein